MNITISKTPLELGHAAALCIKEAINDAINKNGIARIILSTGSSQFETMDALTRTDIDWSKVEMFHLDEYINLPITHEASFRKYLMERFVSKIDLKAYYLVDGQGDIDANIKFLNETISKVEIDVGVIGIGENSHIAFNDPPANFDTQVPYIVVDLDEKCKMQQVGEGWFENLDAVPKQAISMSVNQILKCKTIVSAVPHKVKAKAVEQTLNTAVSNLIPATVLKEHKSWNLFLDEASASYIGGDNAFERNDFSIENK